MLGHSDLNIRIICYLARWSLGESFCVAVMRWQRSRAGKEKYININKIAGLSRDWVGDKILFMCFFKSVLMGEKKHINRIPPQKNPGTIP